MAARHHSRLNQLVEYPIRWPDAISPCFSACSTCVLPHLKAAVVPVQAAGSLSSQVSQKRVRLLLAGPAEAVSGFPQLEVAVCMFYIWPCRSRSGSLTAHQRAGKHRCCFSAFPSVKSSQKSLLSASRDSPEMENTPKVSVDLLSLPQHQAGCSSN